MVDTGPLLGTPQTLIDMTGTVAWSAQYSAFGDAQIQTETVTNNLRFPGQYYDAETGLHYNFQRYYDPQSGRYTQADPLGFDAGDVNWYAYVGNNPINEIDPLGLITGVEFAAACLATSPCREIVVAGTAAAALAVGKAAQDVYNSLPPVYISPMPPLGAPSVGIPGYPDIRPRSPFFPQCDPFPMTSYPPNRRPPSTPPGPKATPKAEQFIPPYGGPLNITPPPPPPICEKLLQIMRDAKKGEASQAAALVALIAFNTIGCEESF